MHIFPFDPAQKSHKPLDLTIHRIKYEIYSNDLNVQKFEDI